VWGLVEGEKSFALGEGYNAEEGERKAEELFAWAVWSVNVEKRPLRKAAATGRAEMVR